MLDPEGRQVWQGDVAVISPNEGRVTIVRGSGGSTGAGGPAGGGAGGQVGGGQVGGGQVAGGAGASVQVTEMTCADVCTPVVPAPAKSK